jgi:hypothetical protein
LGTVPITPSPISQIKFRREILLWIEKVFQKQKTIGQFKKSRLPKERFKIK